MQTRILAALLFVAVSQSPAREGDIDPVYPLGVPKADGRVWDVVADAGFLYVATDSVYRLDRNGRPDPSYASDLDVTNTNVRKMTPVRGGLLALITESFVIRLGADGKIDKSFAPAFSGLPPPVPEVGQAGPHFVDIGTDSKRRIIVTGSFAAVNGNPTIARIDPSGAFDSGFVAPESLSARYVAVMPDDRLWVADAAGKIVRLNEDGSLDTKFQGLVGARVFPLSDGNVHISNGINLYCTDQSGRLVNSFNMAPHFQFGIDAVAASNGKIFVSGSVIDSASRAVGTVLRLNSDGSLDPSWSAPEFPNNRVEHLAIDDAGRPVISLRIPVTTKGGESGLLRLESTGPSSTWHNTSARGRVSPGEPLVLGFVISGRDRRVLLRAVSGSLASFGVKEVLSSPGLAVYRGAALVLRAQGTSTDKATEVAAGAFPLDGSARDTSVLTTLAPGSYTLVVSAESGSGTVLAEIYSVSAD